jgi:uncharacterized membrane protein
LATVREYFILSEIKEFKARYFKSLIELLSHNFREVYITSIVLGGPITGALYVLIHSGYSGGGSGINFSLFALMVITFFLFIILKCSKGKGKPISLLLTTFIIVSILISLYVLLVDGGHII